MADPLSVTASVLGVASAAMVAVRSLCDTVKSYRNRDKTLGRLQNKLQDLENILDSLMQSISADSPMLTLLEGPIDRCKDICGEFEQSMRKFHGKSKTGLIKWTQLEFMKGDINDFIETVEGYKSTITVGLGTINLRNSKISQEVLQQYEELIKDTSYNLELHLQEIDDKLTRLNGHDTITSNTNVDLRDEVAVTQQCLRICKDARTYIGLLATRESTLLRDTTQSNAENNIPDDFEAQVLLRQAFNKSQATFLGVITRLGERLQSVVSSEGPIDENERIRLQEDLDMSKKCLQVCKVASEVSRQKIYRVKEAVAEEDSDQVVVTTLADLFEVGKALSKDHSAQLVASLTSEDFKHVIGERYKSRFGVSSDGGSTTSPSIPDPQSSRPLGLSLSNRNVQPFGSESRRERPNPNEMRKRYGDEDSGAPPKN